MATGFEKGEFDTIDQLLLCQICMHPLVNQKARQLSCLHTFCQGCLETILTRKPGRQIMCSICRQVTELPTGQVTDLPLNFNIDQVQQMAEALVQIEVCSKCCKRKEYIPATHRCITCRRLMCDTCRKQHDRLPGFLTHQLEQIEKGVADESEESCKIHKSKFCLFCGKCKVLLCSQCMTKDEHDSHTDDIQTMDAAMSEIQSSLSDRKRVVVKQLDFVKEKIEVKTRQLEHLGRVEKDIIKKMDSLKSNIDKSGNSLIKELRENYIVKIEQQKAHLTDMLKNGTSNLKKIEDLGLKTTLRLLNSSEAVTNEISEFDKLMAGLKYDVEIEMVKFRPTKQQKGSVIGKLERNDLPPVVREPTRRDLLTPDDLSMISKQLRNPVAAKPTLVKSYRVSKVAVNTWSDIATLGDGSAVFTGYANDEILRINHQGDIISRYKPDGGDKIKSFSAFNKTIVCTLYKQSHFPELTVDHKKIALTKSHSSRGIQAGGVCVDCSGHIILYDMETVTKLDNRDNIVWRKTVKENCHRVKSGLLDNKQWYLVHHSSTGKTEIWNEAGGAIGALRCAPHVHHLDVRDMTVSHRGTFIVTHWCNTCFSDNCYTVTEYAPDGSFIRHLLTQEDGVHCPYRVSCDQQGYMWISDTSSMKIHIYKLS